MFSRKLHLVKWRAVNVKEKTTQAVKACKPREEAVEEVQAVV